MRKFSAYLLIIFLCTGLLFTGCEKKKQPKATKEAKTQFKAAFVYVGPIGDAGWTFAHNEGRRSIEERGVKTAYFESVPEGAEAERVITQFADEGYNLVFTTSYGYMDTTIKVAQKYPKVVFGHCSGYKRAQNVFTYFGRMYQPQYLAGIIAGKMTKTGKIGYVSPHPIPEVIRHINAFTLGARSVNPAAQVQVVWTNSWFDPTAEKDAAVVMMDAGCDLIATGADSAAPLQAAQERNLPSFGYDSDARQFAPKSFLTAPIWDWSVIYQDVIKKMEEGFTDWENLDYWGGLETGVVKLAPYSDLVPADVRQIVDAKAEEIAQDDNIFVGPIKDQKGTVKVEDGVKLTDAELLSMKWFVEGVAGTIPE